MLYTLMEVFQGDFNTFHRIRITVRREIEKNANEIDEKKIRQQILDLEEARKAISSSLIQGKLVDDEFYRYKVRPDLFMGSNTPVKDDLDVKHDMNIDDLEINDYKNSCSSDGGCGNCGCKSDSNESKKTINNEKYDV